jgi:thioredoxin-like negative regulator of GroEL
MGLQKLNDDTFWGDIKIKKGRTLVHFSAPYLAELSQEVDHVLEELSSKFKWLGLASVDTDASPRTATAEEVTLLPTLVLYVEGQAVYRYLDIQEADLYALEDKLDGKLRANAP